MSFDHTIVLSFLRHNLSGDALNGTFVFRRVKAVTFAKDRLPVYTRYTLPDEEPEVVPRSSISRDELDKSVRITCKSFRGVTDNRAMREEPESIYNKSISFSSDSYHNFDVCGLTFDLIKSEPITPIAGDLVCAFFANGAINTRTPQADAWFIASDQYLRAITAILYERHDSLTTLLPKNVPREEYNSKLKEKLFCGNKLMTNSWLKTKLAYEQNGETMPRDVSIKNYWHLRSDNTSRYWVDVWCALVLIARYGELPSDNNVPNNKGGEYTFLRKEWHLPEGFVDNLLSLAGCSIDEAAEDTVSKDSDFRGYEDSHSEVDEIFSEWSTTGEDTTCSSSTEPTIYCWPDNPEEVKKWLEMQRNTRKNQGCEKTAEKEELVMPELEKAEEKVEEKKGRRTALEITLTISWSHAEEGEDKY